MGTQETARRAWALLTSLMEIQKRRMEGEAARFGLTQVSAYALYALRELPPGPIGALATTLDIDPGWATVIVDRLEKRGLVKRRPSETDRRVRVIEITPRGAHIVGELRGIVMAPEPFASLPERDLQTLLRIAERASALAGAGTRARPTPARKPAKRA